MSLTLAHCVCGVVGCVVLCGWFICVQVRPAGVEFGILVGKAKQLSLLPEFDV